MKKKSAKVVINMKSGLTEKELNTFKKNWIKQVEGLYLPNQKIVLNKEKVNV